MGEVAALLELYVAVHLTGHGHSSLVDSFIVEHQTHVAVQADCGLLATSQPSFEIFGEIEGTMHLLLADQLARLI